jgi:subtilase family serine protease
MMLGPAASAIAAAKTDSSCVLGGGVCFVPAALRQAYDFPSGAGAPTGAGQTILIVDAYGAPDISQDLASFDGALGIPAPPSFTIVSQQTPVPGAAGSGATFSWEIETSLDVEYAHAMAPGANIVLAVASSDDTADLAQVESEVLPRYPGAIVSQSFGFDETLLPGDPFGVAAPSLYAAELASGGTVLASSGDFGATDGTDAVVASYPASDPLVLAIGGTQGLPPAPSARDYTNEQVWNERSFGAATGGAPSAIFAAPAWQVGVTGQTARAEPDVSYNAAINGGVVVILSCPPDANQFAIGPCDPSRPLAGVVGGTSAGSPQWAAIVALTNEARGRTAEPRIGQIAPLLYALASNENTYDADFHDIQAGDNILFGSKLGFRAGPGYDLATGLGTPDVSALMADLVLGPSGPTPAAAPYHGPGHGGHGRAHPGG